MALKKKHTGKEKKSGQFEVSAEVEVEDCSQSNDEEMTPSAEAIGSPTEEDITDCTFESLGVTEALCTACHSIGWTKPTKIQQEVLPVALDNDAKGYVGRDVIGVAETGSGKTGAFVLPILQALMKTPQRLFALVLTPTRELADQIRAQFEALGRAAGVTCVLLIGGMDKHAQKVALEKKPHIVIATPGRLVDHLEGSPGFNLKKLKFLVMDEADRILNMDFEAEVRKILGAIPRERRTLLFSATMTKKVAKLLPVSLKDPIKVEVSSKYQTVEKLHQAYIFVPLMFKDVYLVHILNELAGNSFMIFCATCNHTQRVALMLHNLGFTAIPLHGQMSQEKRQGSLNNFKAQNRSILVATDVASRGLDIPHVDVVINYDIPTESKQYIHRVGRTARAGRAGRAITIVTQYDVELYQRIEHVIQKKLPVYETTEEEVMVLAERVKQAQDHAVVKMKELAAKKKKGKKGRGGDEEDGDDTEQSIGIQRKIHGKVAARGGGGKNKKKRH
ncbi:putative ATP-dependent RNA helicase DDX47 [Hypsibius exemplaris]|uniref:RNA helicase n=1 Tax=Hypsibius exemplaris TaxID=2072580 RepID=A0A9X6NHC2_HYPEX|nr:putative ATP-dependent RNA helicase DDX47 [Hypsibius exemplaris]